ncbi:MAG TPA: MFS transporter, partial [Actinomycetota bacterium]|nr:MFS transporter [Actinomycetota bacterium]
MLRRGIALFARSRDFTWLMGAQFLAQAGDGVVQTALAKSIAFGDQRGFDIEGARSPDELLRIALYLMVPYTIVSPFLGVVIDRWDRRKLLVLANGLRAVALAAVALAGVDAVGDLPLFLAFMLTLVSTRIVLATKAAALPSTVGSGELVEGNAVSQLGGALFQLGGVGVAFVAAELVDVEPIVLAGALVYGGGALCARALRRAGETRPGSSFGAELARIARSIAAGLVEVARTPKAGASIATYLWLRFLWSFTLVGIGFVARRLLAGDDLAIAALIGGSGALGAALGFLAAVRLHERARTTARLVLAAAACAGLAVALLGALQAAASLAALAFVLGLGFFVAKISLDTMVQEALGDDFRGRAFSLYDIAYNLAWVLAAGVMVAAWSRETEGALLAGAGVVFLAGLAGLAAWFARAGLLA